MGRYGRPTLKEDRSGGLGVGFADGVQGVRWTVPEMCDWVQPGTCPRPAQGHRSSLAQSVAFGGSMSIEWEQYRGRYTQRPEMFEAYVEVWTRVPEAQQEFSGWAVFSQSANGEPKLVRDKPGYVARAERLMDRGGYERGPDTARGARRWMKKRR